MKHSPKNDAPSAFSDWMNLANDDWQPSWGNFQNPQKKKTHEALLVEQGYVCAYCGCGLKEDCSDSHIEHFWPRSRYEEKSLSYENFFASCGPYSESQNKKTCGDAKEDWHEPENSTLIPSHYGCEQRFRYGANGKMSAFDSTDAIASGFVIALNLNETSLELERKTIIMGLEKDIEDGLISSANKAQEIASSRALDPQGRAKPFGHVAAVYLEQEII